LARYISLSKRAAYEDDGWQIIEYHHHFLKGVLAVKEVEKT